MWGRIIIVDFYLDAKEKEKNLSLLLKGCYFFVKLEKYSSQL